MENKTNNMNSPFAKTYDGSTHGNVISYAPNGEFKKTLLKFMDNHFGKDLSVSEKMDIIVKDYFFRYAYETKGYYERTIVCALSKGNLHYALEDDAYEPINYEKFKNFPIEINEVGVLNRYVKSKFGDGEFIYLDDEMIDDYSMIGALAYDIRYNDLDQTTKVYVHKSNCGGFGSYDGYYFDVPFDEDAIILELNLNNILDANFNGIYCYENTDGTPKKDWHVGINIVNLSSDSIDFHVDAFPILYYWSLDKDFNVKIECIFKINSDDLEKLINKYAYDDINVIGNLNQLIAIGTGFEIRLKEELKHKQELEQQLYDSEQRIKRLKKSIEMENKANE